MDRKRVGRLARICGVAIAIVALPFGATSASAAKPTDKPATTLKLGAVVSGFDVSLNYQVNVPAAQIAGQTCWLSFQLTVQADCDATPDPGSGAKLTKFSVSRNFTASGAYGFEVDVTLTNGNLLVKSVGFAIAAGPAVRFSVTGLVAQPSECYVGINCSGFPPASYPRQIATIRALDAYGNVATGYAGTVTFTNPVTHGTPDGLVDMTLTNGVGYVPVLVPTLSLGFFEEPFTSNCPSDSSGNGIVLTAADTVDPTIFGCQNIPGGDLTLVFPAHYFDASTVACPTGCLSEPTGNITIDTNIVVPTSLTSTIYPDGSMIITGAAITHYYFTQSVNVGALYVEGQAIPPGTLDPCTQCTTGLNYYAGSAGALTGGTIEITNSVLTVSGGNVTVPWSPTPVAAPVNTTTVGASTPTCYLESSIATIVDIHNCQ